MDPTDTSWAQNFFCHFNPPSNLVGGFNAIDLHIHDADAKLDPGRDFLQRVEVFTRPVSYFQHQVIGMQGVEKFKKRSPLPLANALAAIVAEAEVHRPLAGDTVEQQV